ncbi:hypothetical protein SAMN04489712_102324 [Thermomonospora echinospora]|uniref:Uncharacterized protein n=1 Tax=Thermomonospora echinospora TaxID=1992 RepID=A0A1H5VJE9_9ACTN|nr:hypothetical protein [Thermomonospora echinospora]SEF86677.1 hypothetical protein SAMN04489712_102324 [Thermomonospora echinospora]
MHPERIAAELDARTDGWAILFGRYTMQLVALHLNGPGVVSASTVAELEHRMALVESAVLPHRNTAQDRPGTRHDPDGTWTPQRPDTTARRASPHDGTQSQGNGRR